MLAHLVGGGAQQEAAGYPFPAARPELPAPPATGLVAVQQGGGSSAGAAAEAEADDDAGAAEQWFMPQAHLVYLPAVGGGSGVLAEDGKNMLRRVKVRKLR